MTTPDRALEAAKELRLKFNIVVNRADENGFFSEDVYEEEIASVLLPYMESEEESFSKRSFREALEQGKIVESLLDESKRKDEQITMIREFIEKEIEHDNQDIKAYDGADFACELAKSHRIALQSVLRLMNPPDDGTTLGRGEM